MAAVHGFPCWLLNRARWATDAPCSWLSGQFRFLGASTMVRGYSHRRTSIPEGALTRGFELVVCVFVVGAAAVESNGKFFDDLAHNVFDPQMSRCFCRSGWG
ncbi:hypothetical protein ARMGADRAFT_758012 [Armillaria gallica]|uniref:Uncharacterized protein n=1 Tax=Armillaria gallica TaxID=47427 RepID=A0A2H3E8W7_ARMGA|nr:hypothetical protein ARMGADRAFT_758012 [Armillaria gallica]